MHILDYQNIKPRSALRQYWDFVILITFFFKNIKRICKNKMCGKK